MSQSWMDFYAQYVETKFCSNEICMDEVHWYYDGFSSAEFAHPSKNICAGVASAEECEQRCETHCPQAAAGMRERCQYKKGLDGMLLPLSTNADTAQLLREPRRL